MRVIYVDDESTLLENFRLTVEGLSLIDELNLFRKSEDALKWAEKNPVDVAFLDIEMPMINGIELAKRLKETDQNIRIVFVTAFEQYALQAFGVEAIGYLLKPYSRKDVEKELEKASYVRPRPRKKVDRAYSFGDGTWQVEGDTTSYAGGRSFYVKKDGEYTFTKKN